MALTPKQEAFATEVASGKSQADAYRAAYSAENMKPPTVQKRASELMARGDIAGRVAELRKPIADKAQMTLESHLRDLMMLRNIAVKEKQISAAITAEIARGKAAGIYTDKVDHSSTDGTMTTTIITRVIVDPRNEEGS